MRCFARFVPGSAGVPTGKILLGLALLALVSVLACAPHHHAGDDEVSADDDDNDNNDEAPDDDDDNDNDNDDDFVWTQMQSDFAQFYGVSGTAHDDVFAVGSGDDGGEIFHFDGASWLRMDGAPTDFHGSGIWCNTASDVFVAGDGVNSVLLHYDGAAWSKMKIANLTQYFTPLFAVWGSSASDVYAVGGLREAGYGSYGNIAHYDGHVWTGAADLYQEFYGVWGSSASDVFAVGSEDAGFYIGAALHYDGQNWLPMPSATILGYSLQAIWGASPTDVFAAGGNYSGATGVVAHYDGASWSVMVSNVRAALTGLWGTAHSDVFAVGNDLFDDKNGTILHYEGSSWSTMDGGPFPQLFGVWGVSPGDVFAVGFDSETNAGVILHYGPPE